jgi:multiple sugar transport system permease protein
VKTLKTLEWQRNKQGYFYIALWVFGFLAFSIIPMLTSVYISFLKWDGLTEATFVGFGNYIKLIAPPKPSLTTTLFWRAMANNGLYMVFSGVGGLVLSIFMAVLMNERIPGHRAFRVIFFLPTLVVPVAFGLMMIPMYQTGSGGTQMGVLNWLITRFGGHEINFLGEPKVAIWTLIVTSYWTVGSGMIVFMAGLAGLPVSYFEAAKIDGAGWWTRLFKITLPLLSPVIFFQTIMCLIGGLNIFDLAASLSGMGGGPTNNNMGPNNSLATLVFYLYQKGWRDWRMGEAAAIGWIILFIGVLFTLIILKVLRRKDSQEAGGVESV